LSVISNLIKSIISIGNSNITKEVLNETAKTVSRKGAHSKAISEGLRLGSSEAGKVMAKWRWK